jgi:hypothetical protein
MATQTYRNITTQDLNIIGIGVVKAGASFETDQEIFSQNIVLVEEVKKEKVKSDG